MVLDALCIAPQHQPSDNLLEEYSKEDVEDKFALQRLGGHKEDAGQQQGAKSDKSGGNSEEKQHTARYDESQNNCTLNAKADQDAPQQAGPHGEHGKAWSALEFRRRNAAATLYAEVGAQLGTSIREFTLRIPRRDM